MKTLNIDNVDGIAIKLQQVKVEVGGIAADEEMVLSISEDGAHAEIWRGCEPIRFTGPQAKRFARQLLRMSKELKTAEEQTGRDSKLTEKERFCLDAYIANGDAYNAYLLSRESPVTTTSPESLAVMVSRWFGTRKVMEYLAMRKEIKSLSAESIIYTPVIGNPK